MIIDKKKYHKEYYQKNRDLLLERFKQKILCPTCNRKLCLASFQGHLRTNYHKNRISLIRNNNEQPKEYTKKENNNFNKVDNITVSF